MNFSLNIVYSIWYFSLHTIIESHFLILLNAVWHSIYEYSTTYPLYIIFKKQIY